MTLYLLIDRFADEGPVVSLRSKPHGGRCWNHEGVPFGHPIEIPAPFGFSLGAKDF